ncbi:MAG: RbsD/FucU family protein [bacterium]
MLRTNVLHPQVLAALGAAGHGSRVLISDGNYPHATKRGPRAELVFANFMPGVLDGVTVLEMIATAVPIESVAVMQYATEGAYALEDEPPIWNEYRRVLEAQAGFTTELDRLERFTFYEVASGPDVALTVATAEQAIYANLLLTIGVVQ